MCCWAYLTDTTQSQGYGATGGIADQHEAFNWVDNVARATTVAEWRYDFQYYMIYTWYNMSS